MSEPDFDHELWTRALKRLVDACKEEHPKASEFTVIQRAPGSVLVKDARGQLLGELQLGVNGATTAAHIHVRRLKRDGKPDKRLVLVYDRPPAPAPTLVELDFTREE